MLLHIGCLNACCIITQIIVVLIIFYLAFKLSDLTFIYNILQIRSPDLELDLPIRVTNICIKMNICVHQRICRGDKDYMLK